MAVYIGLFFLAWFLGIGILGVFAFYYAVKLVRRTLELSLLYIEREAVA